MNLEKYKFLIMAVISPLAIILLVLLIKWIMFPMANEKLSDLIDVYQDPVQKETQAEPFIIERKGYQFTVKPLAEFDISALVVSKKKYFSGIDADIVPLDLGVCWGDVAKPEYLKSLQFQQYMRFLIYRIKGALPFGYDYIGTHAGNIHIVPGNNRIKKVALSLGKKDKIRMQGYLISIRSNNYKYLYTRNSSLTREDTGDGACEVMWVNRIRVNNKLYY